MGDNATVRVRWRASDADGDPLDATLDVSSDGGRTFHNVWGGPNGERDRAAAGRPARRDRRRAAAPARERRVQRDDHDLARASSSSGRRPTVQILEPGRNQRGDAGGAVRLRGAAVDDRGRQLTGKRLRWLAGRTVLGRGTTVSAALPAGTRSIRLEATDAAGRTGSASVAVRVRATTPFFVRLSAPRVSRSARTAVLVVSATQPSTLTVRGHRHSVGPEVSRIRVRIGAGPRRDPAAADPDRRRPPEREHGRGAAPVGAPRTAAPSARRVRTAPPAGRTDDMEIAFLGTGTMGAPMARHLLGAGHRVRVWNRTREKAEPLAEQGARVARDPAEAIDGAEVVVTMLLDADATESSAGDALRCARPGAIWWQAGTVGVAGTERLARLAGRHGLAYVDAPVLGTRQPAEEGKLIVLAAGPSDALDRLDGVFGPTAANVLRVGEDPGAATRLKLVANHWVFVLVQGVAETVSSPRALGVAPERWLEAISGGPLDSGYAQLKGKAMLAGEFDPSFGLDNAAKDTRLILQAAADNGLELGFAGVIRDRFAAASAAGHGEEDMSAVVLAGG